MLSPRSSAVPTSNRLRVRAAAAAGTGAVLAACLLGPAAAAQPAGGHMVFGVLNADPAHRASDTQAGIRIATVTVGWNLWEPSEGGFSSAYAAQVRQEIAGYHAAGWQVSIDLGLRFPPSWVLQLPGGQLTDQNGHLSGTPNFEWNPRVMADTSAYIHTVVSSLAPAGVQSYRVGLSSTGEMLYGPNSPGSWWAYGDAQASSPMPGWIPGQGTWAGVPVTHAQVTAWYDWYLGGLVNAEHAELEAFRGSGYTGQLDLLMPGEGATPSLYNRRMAENLATDPSVDEFGTMNTGAVWWQQLDWLGSVDALGGTWVDVTSVGDGTGLGGCQPGDDSATLAQADPWVSRWSDTRWLTYLAHQHGLAVVGENPGGNGDGDVGGIVSLARSCGLQQLQWAWDDDLYQGGGRASISTYGQAIAAEGQ